MEIRAWLSACNAVEEVFVFFAIFSLIFIFLLDILNLLEYITSECVIIYVLIGFISLIFGFIYDAPDNKSIKLDLNQNVTVKLTKGKREKLKLLLYGWELAHKRSKSLVKNLENELLYSNSNKVALEKNTIIRLSKWCHTGSSYKGGQRYAIKISQVLFGGIIERID